MQDIFVPGIIQMLSAEGATSLFVAAHEERADPEYYGLLSMAELIISAERKAFSNKDYVQWFNDAMGDSALKQLTENDVPAELMAVQLEVERFAGGQPAGAKGIIELVGQGTVLHECSGHAGLLFIPCSPRYANMPRTRAQGA